ncbi:MAG: ABC transporter ATP-binding protein [Brevundimonas sp.]|uniref:ABC transporter ATP-binding protein n=1 Tax=Brevundimonas sp. TaxID=1871086 RepID=UPI003919FE2C
MAAVSALSLHQASARLDGRPVLEAVDLAVAPGELVALVGPNGAGKSSALRALAGLLSLTAGETRLNGDDLRRLGHRARADRLAYLPQERRIAWNLPAVELAALGAPLLAGREALERARFWLDRLEIGALADRGVAEMSGGERARVLLARALVADAPALIADEPLAGLDPEAQLLVGEVLREQARAGRAVLMTLHDLTLAVGLANRVAVIDQGRIVADGPPLQALAPPILRSVFGLAGRWITSEGAPLLTAARA